MAIANSLVRYGYAPFMILGLNAAGFALIANGAPFYWLGLILAVAIGAAFLAERIRPCHDEWNHDHGDKQTNILHGLVYEISNINGVLLLPLIAWLTPWDGIWPKDWPLVAQFLLALVFADFALSFLHYLSHRIPLLWRLHAVHHGVPRMYGFNGFVRHPLHQSVDLLLGTLPLALLGMPAEVALLLGLAVSIQLVVQHSNVDYELGPFRNHLSIGRLHHLHHVNWGKEGDVNFGLFFTVWDRLLGTLQVEPSRPIMANDLGVDDAPEFPKGYVAQLVFPFIYTPGTPMPKTATAQMPVNQHTSEIEKPASADKAA